MRYRTIGGTRIGAIGLGGEPAVGEGLESRLSALGSRNSINSWQPRTAIPLGHGPETATRLHYGPRTVTPAAPAGRW